MLADPIKTLKW